MSDIPEPPLERPAAETHWDDFVDGYGRAIVEWFRLAGLPPGDVRELVRELMALLAKEFNEVVGAEGLRFRAWLQFAGHHAWAGMAEGLVDAGGNGHAPRLELLLSAEAHDAFLRSLDAECSRLRHRQILDRVHERTDATDWEAFARTVLEGRPPEAVAVEMGCGDLAVRAAAFRVYRALATEMQAAEEMF